MLFSQSADGVTWSKAALLFPSMGTASTPSAQFAGPFAVLNGRLYASASPAVIADGDAQGAQYCQFPDGLDPRNCNCPGVKHDRLQATLLASLLFHADGAVLQCGGHQPAGLLMLREVLPGAEGKLGPVFWGTPAGPPPQYTQSAARNKVRKLAQMDAQTRGDVAKLLLHGVADGFVPPCDTDGTGTLKCEACPNGCQVYSLSPKTDGLANERAYCPPHASRARAAQGTAECACRPDPALRAAGGRGALPRALRHTLGLRPHGHRSGTEELVRRGGNCSSSLLRLASFAKPQEALGLQETTIPNDNSNLNVRFTRYLYALRFALPRSDDGLSAWAGGRAARRQGHLSAEQRCSCACA